MIKRIYISGSKIFPKDFQQKVEKQLAYAGITEDVSIWLGRILIVGILLSVSVTALSRFGNPKFYYPFSVIVFFGYIYGAAYGIPYFMSKKRAMEIEENLPSLFQLMASNIKAGMTPFQSVKMSSRKEFGVLKDELDYATTTSLGPVSFSESLKKISDRIDLPVLERAVKLFGRSIDSGGKMAHILEETSADISQNMAMRNELITTTRTYMTLVMIIVLFGAPLLLNISIYFVEKLDAIRESIDVGSLDEFGLDGLISTGFDIGFITNVSAILIIGTSMIAGMFIGVVVEGEEKYGLKYSVFLLPITLILFYSIRQAILYIT